MANLRELNPMYVDTVSTQAVPFWPVGLSFAPRRIAVTSTGAGQRLTLRDGGMTSTKIIFDWISTAEELTTERELAGVAANDGIFITSIGAGQTALIY